MRLGMLPITVATVVVVGIIAGSVYYQTQYDPMPFGDHLNSPEPNAGEPANSPASTTASAEAPAPETDAGAAVEPASNPDPDLSVDSIGLSRATVVVNTNKGQFRFKFYTNDAPETVKRLVELINQKFYNGLVFHRVVPGFVVQGGDPSGSGNGGSGQRLKAEFNDRRHTEGTLAMARAPSDPDSADSQFYITLSAQPHLDKTHTVFGQVIEGMDVVRKIAPGDKMRSVHIE